MWPNKQKKHMKKLPSQSMTVCSAFVLVVSSVMDFDLRVFLVGGSEDLLSSSSSCTFVYCDAWLKNYAMLIRTQNSSRFKKKITQHVQTILWNLSTHIYIASIRIQMHTVAIDKHTQFLENIHLKTICWTNIQINGETGTYMILWVVAGFN